MAAEDWKGVAMILQQLGEMAKPSQLDVVEKEYELRSLEKQADREHEFMLQNYKSMQEKYEDQKNTYEDLMQKGNALHAELNDMKEIDYSGNADKVMDSIYGGKYNNYEAGLKMQGEFINQLQNEIVLAQQVNKAGTLGKDFTSQWTAQKDDGTLINYAKDFDTDGLDGLSFDEKIAAIDAESSRRYGDSEEKQNQKNAFNLVARANLDAETEAMETKKAKDEKLAESLKLSHDEQLAREIYESQEKYNAKNADKIARAQKSIGSLIANLESVDSYVDPEGNLKFNVINANPTSPIVKAYYDTMNTLTKAGIGYLYKPAQLTESNFNEYFDKNRDIEVDKGYNYDLYKTVLSGKDTNGKEIEPEKYKWIQQEFEWFINTAQKPDNARTFDPGLGREIDMSVRRLRFKDLIEAHYGFSVR